MGSRSNRLTYLMIFGSATGDILNEFFSFLALNVGIWLKCDIMCLLCSARQHLSMSCSAGILLDCVYNCWDICSSFGLCQSTTLGLRRSLCLLFYVVTITIVTSSNVEYLTVCFLSSRLTAKFAVYLIWVSRYAYDCNDTATIVSYFV